MPGPRRANCFTRVASSDNISTPAQREDKPMAEATDIYGAAFKNGSITLLARVVGPNAAAVVQADILSIRYTVYLLNDRNPDDRVAVEGHANASLAVADVVFSTLQTDAIWTVDAIGYNFRHVLDVSAHQAFAIAGRRYLIEHRLAPADGQAMIVRFRINVI
jgi:hypothetical protein